MKVKGGPSVNAECPRDSELFQGPGFQAVTPAGLLLLIVSIAIAIFYYFITSPGPRVGEALAILGPRERFGGAIPPDFVPFAERGRER